MIYFIHININIQIINLTPYALKGAEKWKKKILIETLK